MITMTFICDFQREKLGTLGRVPEIYTNIYYTYGLYNGCIGQNRVIFGEQLLGYPPKGTQSFPLRFMYIFIYVFEYIYIYIYIYIFIAI